MQYARYQYRSSRQCHRSASPAILPHQLSDRCDTKHIRRYFSKWRYILVELRLSCWNAIHARHGRFARQFWWNRTRVFGLHWFNGLSNVSASKQRLHLQVGYSTFGLLAVLLQASYHCLDMMLIPTFFVLLKVRIQRRNRARVRMSISPSRAEYHPIPSRQQSAWIPPSIKHSQIPV